ncbi:MAG: hypothetical protein JSV88_06605 [Candidatus Aminicenantes bacterium]|nr:MAG: hypothetical protein JSV88_06605 [Candidatus Aminicenantes bacterium]
MRNRLNFIWVRVRELSELRGLRVLREHLLVILFFLLIIFAVYPGLFIHFSTAVMRSEIGDLRTELSIISHSIHAPLTQLYHLPVCYPESYMLTKCPPLFGVSLFIKLFGVMGLSLIQGYNLYIILSLAAGAWGTYLLIKEFVHTRFFPLLFSTIYILHNLNYIHFAWPHNLSRFYLPFIFLFLARYFKTGKKSAAVAAALFSFLQTLVCLYYGFFLWALLIPLFLIFGLIFRVVSFAQLRFPLLCLAVALILIFLTFYPYISQNTAAVKHFDGKLIRVEELFANARIFALAWGIPKNITLRLFPGIVFTIFGLLFFVSFLEKRKRLTGGVLVFFLILMCYLVYANRILLNLVFMVFLVFLVYLTARGWKQMNQWEKLLLLVFVTASAFLFKFTFPAFLESLVPFKLVYWLLPVGGFSSMKRNLILLLPFFAVLASIGAARLFPGIHQLKAYKKRIIFTILLILLAVENIYNPLRSLGYHPSLMKPLPPKAEVYRHLPFNANKVVLEIPYYFRRPLKNALYMLNWRFHQNYLLNGKVTIVPRTYYRKLSRIIGKFHLEFPTQKALKQLIRDYSVSYIIIHWDLLAAYQGYYRSTIPRQEILKRIRQLNRYAVVLYEDSTHILVKLRENFPLSTVVRTYSYFHLKHYSLEIKLAEKYEGSLRVLLNDKLVQCIRCSGSNIALDLGQEELLESGNKLELQFDQDVNLIDIEII